MGVALAAATCVALMAASGAGSATATVAADGPGALSHFDLARKDCLGTARNTTSKVWFTVANGVLSDVYYPTIDNTNVETLQYVVTDGSTFTDLQTRDMTSTAPALDASGMSCRVTSTAASGKYKIVTDYVDRPRPQHVAHAVAFTVADRQARRRPAASTFASIRRSTATAAAERATAAPTRRRPTPPPGIRSPSRPTRTRRRTRPTATMPSRCSPRSTAPFAEVTNGFAGQAERRA